MKRWEYSGGWKLLAVVLNQLCAVVLVLSVIVCTFYVSSGGFDLFGQGDGFENTLYYQSEVEEQIYRCIRAASRESKFEKNGVYDGEQAVDIRQYAQSSRILETEAEEGRLTYRLADLLNWAEEGYVVGTLLETVSGSLEDTRQTEVIEELYAPLGYGSIAEYAEQQKLSDHELQAVYQDLEVVLSTIHNDFYAYQENLELFSPDMTNMRYLILPKEVDAVTGEDYEQKVYTNIKGFQNWKITDSQSLLDYFRGQGDYLIFDSSNMEFEASNMPLSLSAVSNYLKGYQPSVEGHYILAIAIDKDYLASDALQEYRSQYEEVRPLGQAAVYGAVFGAILYILTLVYLTVAAGKGTDMEQQTRKLNGFDRIKTEVALGLLAIPTVLVLWAALTLRPTISSGLIEISIWGGSAAFLLNILFLVGYLSLIRRLRSRTLWCNSLGYAFLEMLIHIFQNWRATTKIIITYLVFLLMNLVLLCCGFPGFLLALLFDFMVAILLIRQALQRQKILDGIKKIAEGDLTHQIGKEGVRGDNLLLAEAVNNISGGLSRAVEQSVKDERLKSDLITNVSHDIKTPLTSIINYVDLLKREDIHNERAKNYIAILENKASRLKQLTDDLVEASKISSGNVKLDLVRINFQELLNQTNGEFCEKFEDKGLKLVVNMPEEPVIIEADGRRLWRIIENLYHNVAKYAMPHTRIYVDLVVVDHMVRLSIKNISEQPLNIEAGELTERFIRGDVARSTEGSGLGLSIAKNLTELQKGSFEIYLDGDLFKATIVFPEAPKTVSDFEEADVDK